ncbi:MAG: hypothetical protein ACI82Z_000543 [Cellvibrionaceae bacterium]|jgi:hypothetical protein
MKRSGIFFIIVAFIGLTACNRSYVLPDKHLSTKIMDKISTGVLAIPKSMESDNGVTLHSGYANQIVITNDTGKALGKPIRLIRKDGYQFVFLNHLEPGNYFVSTVDAVPHLTGYDYSGGDEPHEVNLPFEIKAGHITVLPINFHVVRKGIPLTSATSYLVSRKLEGEVKAEFLNTLAKTQYLNQWEVIWPSY